MDKITLSLDSLSDLFNINASEAATLFAENSDGVKTPIDQSQIDRFVSSKFHEKVKIFFKKVELLKTAEKCTFL
mgnify:CR=1 FL=1